jgi:Na+/H+ antiporter NhaC
MRVITAEGFNSWTQGAGIAGLVLFAWALVMPGGLFWGAALAAGVVGSAVATVLVRRSRSVPTLAQVIASAEAEPAVIANGIGCEGAARLRPRGERKP